MLRPIALALGLTFMAGGCTQSVSLRSGADGPPLPTDQTVAIIGEDPEAPPVAAKAREAVIAALLTRGHRIAPHAADRLEIGLSSRLASTGVAVIDHADLSTAKDMKFLQSCKDRTYRLVLTYYGSTDKVPVTRAWAEEYHCKGTLAASIERLAEKAVAGLSKGSSNDLSRARGRE